MKTLSICIVTADIVGPIRNGGIGTAYYNLARALADAGHRVTVLYALGSFCENKTVGYWERHYRKQRITFVPLPSSSVQGHSAIKMSHAVYEWLKPRHFDVVHCHEWRGVGFYTALGKHQGLILQHSVLCVGAHSPVLWHLEGMNELADAEALEVDFMERESVALADVLWSPSAHMVRWMRGQGWKLPKRIARKPYLLADLETSESGTARPGSELVFFGRLETRKGLDLFCDALDRLTTRNAPLSRVTFLGKPASVGGVPSEDYIQQRARKWSFEWRIVKGYDRDAAMAYLREPNRIAVLPSRLDNLPYTVLECLGSGIPFVASDIGGIPEMIRSRDRERVLFALNADRLAERLENVLKNGLAPAPLRISAERITADWLRWHQTIARSQRSRRVTSSHTPFVSVCVTHRNRPEYLRAAIESLRSQDYEHFEVVVVDDGSDQPEAKAYLDAIEPEFRRRRWHVIRQSNRYLGAARNAAVAAARGDYVLFMDDDNLAAPHEISTFVRAALASDADILTCFLHVFQSRKPVPERAPIHVWPFLGAAMTPGLLRNVFGDANALVRRTTFRQVGGFTEDFGVGCEDWEFFARAVMRGARLEVVPEPLVRYRQSPQGMLQSTSERANRMRALRPYLELLPSSIRPLVHLSQQERQATGSHESAPRAARLDHVRRAAIFGTGEAGRMALDLATKCGWNVPWLVDNNPATWNTTAHGLPVRAPKALRDEPVDLVIVASLAGKPAISKQLETMGLASGEQFVHFLDPVRVNGTTLQLSLP